MVFAQFDQMDQQLGNLQNAIEQAEQQLSGLNLGGGVDGLTSFLPWIILALMAFFLLRRGSGPTLALSEFQINPTARVRNGVAIRIAGRRKGIIGRLFTLVNLDPLTTWTATREAVSCESTSLFGRSTMIVPMRQVDLIRVEHGIPKLTLILAVVVFLAGLANFGSFLGKIACLAGLVLGVSVFFNRRFVISVESGTNTRVGVAVQPSMLGGPAFDLEKLQEAGRLLQKLVRTSERGRGRDDREPAPREAPIRLAPISTFGAEDSSPPPKPLTPPPPKPVHEAQSVPVVPPPSPSVAANSVFQAEGPPRPRPLRIRPKQRARPVEQSATAPVVNPDEEKLATEAFEAAVRVFESKRPSEAEAAWWAIVRRWPNSNAARSARRILDNRRKKERERKER